MKHYYLTGLLSLFSFLAFSQNYLGVHSSNYAGVMAVDLQPAAFVDGRFRWDVNLGSANFTGWQNAKYFDTRDMPRWWVKSFTKDTLWMKPDSTFYDRYFFDNYTLTQNKTLGGYFNSQIDIANFMFHINPKIAIGGGFKIRSIVNIDEVDPKLLKLAENGLDYSQLFNQKFNEKLLNMNSLVWREFKLNYSQVITDEGANFWKAGVSAKYLQGMGAAYMYTDNFGYGISSKDTSFYLNGNFDYGYSGNIDNYIDGSQTNVSTSPASKFGLGLDLGVVYEWRPKWKEYKYDMDGETDLWRRDKNKYKLRVGASVTDIGGMKFTKGGLSRNFTVNSSNPFDLTVFKGVGDLAEFDQVIDSLSKNNPEWSTNEGTGSTFFMNTPTAASVQVDYNIWKDFYINATGIVNLVSKKNPNRVHVANQISVTPSYDFAWFGVHLPLSYNKYSGFKGGIATRLGPLTIGVTDFRTLFASGKIYGGEVYAGLRVPVLYGHPNDRDDDKVSDKMDECIDVPGVWAFKGCPDTDGDGIQDKDDICPETPGLAEFNGCPDRDGDKIPDKDDDCPDLPGLAEFKGCPDTDGDGITDPKDDCPEVAGLAAFNGCPDTDGDGIMDSEDACPEVAGPLVNQGCPDTDGDGILDFLDNCPETYGPEENNGCPWPDTDGDGLLDKDDKCPYLAGPIKNQGCPYQDTDNDGIIDAEDACPNTPGTIENKGCPEIEEEVKEILKTAFDNLEFETAKDVIKAGSIPSLTELAEVLKKRPEWKLQIAGHTDNVGDAQKNMILSKQRAESVKRFMVQQGIDESRLNVLYFGETQPIASNDTPEGRQKNRRVEMTIIFE